jgi:hypothetical protein
MACKPLRKNNLVGSAMVIAMVVIGFAPNAMAQTGGQKAQSTQSSTQFQSSSSDNQKSSDNPFNDFVGAINTLVNKPSNSSSSDGQTKSGKTASQGAGKQTAANKSSADQPSTDDVGKSLADLKDFYQRGLITKTEYDSKRKELLDKIH